MDLFPVMIRHKKITYYGDVRPDLMAQFLL